MYLFEDQMQGLPEISSKSGWAYLYRDNMLYPVFVKQQYKYFKTNNFYQN